jgi:putative pyruvate formate lyase activating enzyme
VGGYGPHFGEEDCLRGTHGSGTLFFGSCSLRCVFCQNAAISQPGRGEETPPARLAAMMLELQAAGCHNLNLVTPEHVVPQILEALVIAAGRGLRLPLVYNTSAYDGPNTLRRLDGVVDIYLPDFKVWDPALALRYLRARNYPQAARQAIREMHRQVGDLALDGRGLARRGVLLRHLVLPGGAAGTPAVMRWLARAVSPHLWVNVMAQYDPAHQVSAGRWPELNRRLTPAEYAGALAAARAAGLSVLAG